jgi:hypothetical protein
VTMSRESALEKGAEDSRGALRIGDLVVQLASFGRPTRS